MWPFTPRAAVDRVARGRIREAVHTAETHKLDNEQCGRAVTLRRDPTIAVASRRCGDTCDELGRDWWRK